jgi:hypothetical protein
MNALAIIVLLAFPLLLVAVGQMLKLWIVRRASLRRPRPAAAPVHELREQATRAA